MRRRFDGCGIERRRSGTEFGVTVRSMFNRALVFHEAEIISENYTNGCSSICSSTVETESHGAKPDPVI